MTTVETIEGFFQPGVTYRVARVSHDVARPVEHGEVREVDNAGSYCTVGSTAGIFYYDNTCHAFVDAGILSVEVKSSSGRRFTDTYTEAGQ